MSLPDVVEEFIAAGIEREKIIEVLIQLAHDPIAALCRDIEQNTEDQMTDEDLREYLRTTLKPPAKKPMN